MPVGWLGLHPWNGWIPHSATLIMFSFKACTQIVMALATCWVQFCLSPAIARAESHPFFNPVAGQGQDPWVIWWNGHYEYCQSRPSGIWVNQADKLEDIGRDHWHCVWHAPTQGPVSRQIWAPELHYLQGHWFVYFAADDGDNARHRMYVLEGSSPDPLQPFELKGKITTSDDHWAIDGTVLEMPGNKLYFIWAGWPGDRDGVQNLYIAAMPDPWSVSGPRVCISTPDRPWEQRDFPHINEGPETLWHAGRLFIIYSASGFWDDNYCLGQLTWTGGDVMNPSSWSKNPNPVFSRANGVLGPGHCSFVPSPDGREEWIVYHAHVGPGTTRRNVRIQPFAWNPDGSPDFGLPVSTRTLLNPPSGE